MATISVADFKTLADSIAKQAEILQTAVGTDGAGSGTSGKGAQNNVDRIVAFTDPDQITDLLEPAEYALSKILSANALPRLLGGTALVNALDVHVGGINSWGDTNDVRVHWLLAEIVSWLNPARVFPPVVDPMATFDVTGSGAGTYAHVAGIDTTKYGKANLVLKTTSAIGAAQIVATITCKKIDGTTEDKEVTIPGSTGSGTEFDIGTHDTDMYVDTTNITITGGTSGESFKILSEIERAIAL
jgi:hypothetical protein